MREKSGLVVYSVQERQLSNYVLEQRIVLHYLGEVPKGNGEIKIWHHIDDLVEANKLEKYTGSHALHFKIVPIEDIQLIKDEYYPLTDWLKYE